MNLPPLPALSLFHSMERRELLTSRVFSGEPAS